MKLYLIGYYINNLEAVYMCEKIIPHDIFILQELSSVNKVKASDIEIIGIQTLTIK